MINPKTAMFGAISIFLYTSVYTPLKTVTSLSVFVVAFRCNPFMLGWVAATGDLVRLGLYFSVFWQFPHFWAIGWFYMKIMKSRFFYASYR
jgi:protoheme IX farnesyltransferase